MINSCPVSFLHNRCLGQLHILLKGGCMISRIMAALLLSFACIFASWHVSLAQEMASIQARAVVLPSMSIVGTHDLDFGNVMPGMNKSVDKIEAGSAGEWVIIGIPKAEINVAFILPNSLKEVDGTDVLPIEFKMADASYNDSTKGGQQIPAGILNPHQVNTTQIGQNGTLGIWLGGEVFPSPSQISGLYTGRVTLTVTYTGN
jgi:hypothetical protein